VFKKEIRLPILALFFLSLGGLMLHVVHHPPRAEDLFNWIPVIVGVVTVFVLPFLFNYRSTVGLAFMLTLLAVAVGTVTMAYYSIDNWDTEIYPLTVKNVLLHSTLKDIVTLFAKVPLGLLILRHFRPEANT